MLLHDSAQALFEVARKHVLHGITVEADNALEQLHAQYGGTELFLLGDNLQQHRACQVLARTIVEHLDLLAAGDQPANILERHVPAGGRIVQSSVGVLANYSGHLHSYPAEAGRLLKAAACYLSDYAAHK